MEESVWPKSPATPKEKVGVAAAAVGGLPHRPGAIAASPTSSQRQKDHDRPAEPQAQPGGAWSAPAALTARTSSVIGLREAASPELNPTATPVLSSAALTPAPGSPDSGGSVFGAGAASKSTACGRSTPSAPRTWVGPHRAPVHQARCPACGDPLALPWLVRVPADVPRDGLAGPRWQPPRCPPRCRCHRSRGRCPTPPPSAGRAVTLPPLSHTTGVKWSLRLGAAHGDALAVDAVGVGADVARAARAGCSARRVQPTPSWPPAPAPPRTSGSPRRRRRKPGRPRSGRCR